MEMISIILTVIWFAGFIYYTERIVKNKEGIVAVYDAVIEEHPEMLIYFSTRFILSVIYFVNVCLNIFWPILLLFRLFNKIL